MKWSEPIVFKEPLRDVALLAGAPAESWDGLMRTHEEAAYQRARADVESSLRGQLTRQSAEIAHLQQGVLAALSSAVSQVINESETAVISLALEAARRVIADLPIEKNLIEAVVREALSQAEDSAELTVQLNPEDLALLRKHGSSVLEGMLDKGPLRFVASGEVTRGGCLVQTRFGVIDARREVKFEQLAQALST
ncbi:MAG TPA: FliH/SctL family protein [Verrucomicrobiae bacterium]|nr:FliH/SctL family protein [Verrucomicrobiae bacterium]